MAVRVRMVVIPMPTLRREGKKYEDTLKMARYKEDMRYL